MNQFPKRIKTTAWAFCDEGLMRANFEDGQRHGLTLKRGQFLFGREEMADLIGVKSGQIRTIVDRLIGFGVLTTKPTSSGTIATFCDFDSYNTPPGESNQQNPQRRAIVEPAKAHSEEQKSKRAGDDGMSSALSKKDSTGVPRQEQMEDYEQWWRTENGKEYEHALREAGYDLDGAFGTDERHQRNTARANRTLVHDYWSAHGDEGLDLALSKAREPRIKSKGAFLRNLFSKGDAADEIFRTPAEDEDNAADRDTASHVADDDLPF